MRSSATFVACILAALLSPSRAESQDFEIVPATTVGDARSPADLNGAIQTHFVATPVGSTSVQYCLGVCFDTPGGTSCDGSGTIESITQPQMPFHSQTVRKIGVGESCLEGTAVSFPVVLSSGESLSTNVQFSPTTTDSAVGGLSYNALGGGGLEYLLTGGSLRVVDASFSHPRFPDEVPVSIANGGASFAGNPVAISVTVENTSQLDPPPYTIEFAVNGEHLPGVFVDPNDPTPGDPFLQWKFIWYTHFGFAWNSGLPASAHDVEVLVRSFNGITFDSDTSSIGIHPRPVILVHGFFSDADTWSDLLDLFTSTHPQWQAFAVDSLDTDPWDSASYGTNAASLGQYIDAVRTSTNAWVVDVVAHSMGGLITRQYVHSIMKNNPFDSWPTVGRLLMLGTPNRGSYCARAEVRSSALLSQKNLDRFNTRVTKRKGTYFVAFAGDIGYLSCLFEEPIVQPADGWVEVSSAIHGMSETRQGAVEHTEMTSGGVLVEDFILDYLTERPVAPEDPWERSVVELGSPVQGGSDPPLTAVESQLAIESGQTLELEAFIPQVESASFGLIGEVEKLQISLLEPSGESAGSVVVVDSAVGVAFHVQDPIPGIWSAEVTNVSQDEVQVGWLAYVHGSSRDLTVESTALSPAFYLLEATLSEAANPVIGAEVTGNLSAAGRPDSTVALADSGTGGDALPDDGVYSVILGPLSASDLATPYSIVVRAQDGNGVLYKGHIIVVTDHLFSDGFETGDTEAWTTTVGSNYHGGGLGLR